MIDIRKNLYSPLLTALLTGVLWLHMPWLNAATQERPDEALRQVLAKAIESSRGLADGYVTPSGVPRH